MEQLIDRLRAETADDHRRLEDRLDLLALPLSRARFAAALAGFHAFHAAWEPRVEALVADPAFLAPRRRMALLEADLAAVGPPPGGDGVVEVDLAWLDRPAAAWGSLYVMEGSTLGGQVISKALQGADWVPPGGLAYFNPYGRETAMMWKVFRERLQLAAGGLDPDLVVSTARQTFAVLADILPLRCEEAAA